VKRHTVRKVDGRWTTTSPGYGFNPAPTVTTHRTWRAAMRATEPRPGDGNTFVIHADQIRHAHQGVVMSGTKPNPGTPADQRKKGRGAKPGPKKGSKNSK
jgi:hypothetical protein